LKNKVGYNIKYDINYIREQFEKENFILLVDQYKNQKQKLEFICPNGHKHSVSWSDWLHGDVRCAYCYGNIKYTIEEIKAFFKKENYVLLSKSYNGAHSLLKYICPHDHHHQITWVHFRKGIRCPSCYGNAKLNIDFIEKKFKEENYILLTKEYKNNNQKLRYMCPNGHQHSITWAKWQSGNRCFYCHGNVKLDIEYIRKEFEKAGYKLLTKNYINSHAKLIYICPLGHEHSISWAHFQRGTRCPVCAALNMSGESHPQWKGGISCEPYCEVWLDKDFKESIKARDNHKCQNPLCSGEFKKLCVHHIDYNKKHCHPQNLITLCVSCNGKANKDREWHTAFYKEIMRRNNFSKNQINQEDLSWKEKIL